MNITTIGLDLAKNVLPVHGVDANGKTVLQKQLKRAQVLTFFAPLPKCLVGMEACPGAHYWARELVKLGQHRQAHAGPVRQTLCQAQQDRRQRCRGNLRGRHPSHDALCQRQYRGPARHADAAPPP